MSKKPSYADRERAIQENIKGHIETLHLQNKMKNTKYHEIERMHREVAEKQDKKNKWD